MTPAKPIIFSIHGIYTDGPWQEGAAVVLEPFFQYRPLKYAEYRRWAILKLGADVFFAIASLAFGICLVHFGLLRTWGLVLYALTALAGVFIVNFLARRFRTEVITKLYEVMTAISGNSFPPSIVAHSLGTYIVGRALRQFQEWSCDTIILTGCVLRRRFPWATMDSQFKRVSNEVARMDVVPFAATLLSLSVRDMGCAGVLGFASDMDRVHNIYPNTENPNCHGKRCLCSVHVNTPLCETKVHNIHHQLLRHSDYFKGKNHAWKSWLPTLWGYDPVLYRLFIEACQRCDLLEKQVALISQQNDALDYLKNQCWGWTYGNLEQFVERELRAELAFRVRSEPSNNIRALTNIIINALWGNVSKAAAESDILGNRRDRVLEHLNPRISLKRCIAATLDFA